MPIRASTFRQLAVRDQSHVEAPHRSQVECRPLLGHAHRRERRRHDAREPPTDPNALGPTRESGEPDFRRRVPKVARLSRRRKAPDGLDAELLREKHLFEKLLEVNPVFATDLIEE